MSLVPRLRNPLLCHRKNRKKFFLIERISNFIPCQEIDPQEAHCSWLGNVYFQLWYFYTNDIKSSKRRQSDRMQAPEKPNTFQSSALPLHHIEKTVPLGTGPKWYISLICSPDLTREPHQTQCSRFHASKYFLRTMLSLMYSNILLFSSIIP